MSSTNIITVKENPIYLWGNDPNSWLIFAAIALAIYLLVELARSFFQKRLLKVHKKTYTYIDDAILAGINSTYKVPIILVSLFFGSRYITMPEHVSFMFNRIVATAFIIQVGVWMSSFVGTIISSTYSRQGSSRRSALNFISFISRLAIWALTFLVVLDNLGVNISTFVAGLGIGGIAVAMALQNILGDLFSSLSIILDKPFEEGDYVVINDLQGNVEKIGIKTTRVRSLSGEEIVFSNSDLLSSRIRNYKTLEERRICFMVGVTYETPYGTLNNIPKVISDIISSYDSVRLDRVHFKAFGDFSLNFEIVYYVLDPTYLAFMDIQQKINYDIFKKFEELNIEFAYPTQKIFIEKDQ